MNTKNTSILTTQLEPTSARNSPVEDLYSGVFDDTRIIELCNKLRSLNPNGATCLVFVNNETKRCEFGFVSGIDDATQRQLERDPSLLRHAVQPSSHARLPAPSCNLDFTTRESILSSPTYSEFLSRVGGAHHVDFVSTSDTQPVSCVLMVAYPRGTEAERRKAVIPTLSEVGPHLPTVMALRLCRLRELDRALNDAIAACVHPAVLVDDHFNVLKANTTAERYLAETSDDFMAAMERGERPAGSSGAGEPWMSTTDDGSGAETLSYWDCHGDFVVARRTPVAHPQGSVFKAQLRAERLGEPIWLITLTTTGRKNGDIAPEIVRAFNLTHAEQRLIKGLLDGKQLSEIADANVVSYNTVRNQLAGLAEKTHLHGQVSLVRFFGALH